MNLNADRKLAAIMFTDIVGYTAMMQQDEERAIRLRAKHRKIFEEQHGHFDGQIIQYYGDGTLSVFKSAVAACTCAIEIQRHIREGEEVLLRIGIHLGDIVFDATEIYGDAVNLAARIENLAVGGSILLSKAMNRELENQKSISTRSLGFYEFKNIKDAEEVFAVVHEHLVVPLHTDLAGQKRSARKSLAVLPFANMSANPENEYLSDGLTEEIINGLAKIENLKVTSRTSSFFFKDKSLPLKDIAAELEVSAILEGSLRINGSNLRITAQLIDVDGDFHFWSETWDSTLDDLFAIQDEISLNISDRLREQFGHFPIPERRLTRQDVSSKVYALYLKAKFHKNKWNAADMELAIDFFEQAIEVDPNHVECLLGLADCYSFLATTGFLPYARGWEISKSYLLQAREVNEDLAEVRYQTGNLAFFIEGDFSRALREMLLAVETKPNHAQTHQFLSFLYIIRGNRRAAQEHIDRALALDPMSEETRFFEGFIHYMIGDFDAALQIINERLRINDKNIPAHSVKASILLCLKQYDSVISYFDAMPDEVLILEEQLGSKMLGHLLKGDADSAITYLEELIALLDGPNAITASSFVFHYHVLSGDLDSAFLWLDTAIESKSYVPSMRIFDPLVKALRKDPRFDNIVRKIFSDPIERKPVKTKRPLMDDAAAEGAIDTLTKHLEHARPFLDPEITLRSLAQQVDLSPNQLSWLINERLDKNFNDLINHHRIQTFKELASDPSNAGLTIMGLAFDSGFNSKTTFNTSFKKETGMTPKEFLNEV